MHDDDEVMLKKICCTCLSTNRKLFQLCRIVNGVNNLYWLLSYDSEAFREVFHMDTANLYICWECKAVMSRICGFRSQACIAQRHLTNITEGRCDRTTKFLSKLTHSMKDTYDYTFVYADSHEVVIDNFIDCGPIIDVKAESDLDDIPLADLHNNFITDKDIDNIKYTLNLSRKSPDLNSGRLRKKFKTNTSVKENSGSLNCNKLYCSMMKMSEEEMMESRNLRKCARNYLDAEFKCEHCIIRFEVKTEFNQHNIDCHEKKNQYAECSICKSYVKISRLNSHRREHYLKYVCRLCDLVTFDSVAILDHLVGVHDVKDSVMPTKKSTKKSRWIHVQRIHREGFGCSTCGKRFSFKNNLTRHEQTHAPSPPRVECATCHKRVRADLMRAHSRIHGERERHSCAQCEKSFASRASYEHHLKYTRVHAVNVILKYKCSVCDKSYKSKGELRDHINYQHMGKTQHKCPVCGKALATRRCVTRHVKRAHDGIKESERDKICQQCGKAFRDKKGLREHELIHTGERPLSCEICGCTFRQNATLYTHKKRVHKIYPKRKQVELMESEIPNT